MKEDACYQGDVAPEVSGSYQHWWGCHQTYICHFSSSGSPYVAALIEMITDEYNPLPSSCWMFTWGHRSVLTSLALEQTVA